MSFLSRQQGQRILRTLRRRSEAMAQLLERLAEQESPSTTPEAQGPLLAMIAGLFRDLGLRTRLLPGRNSGGCLLAVPARRTRGLPCQLLLGHADTVWPLGTRRKMPVHREDGRLAGPGVYDMKGGIVMMIEALRALRELGAEPPLPPVVLINTDEEIGSRESTRYIRRLARIADRCLVLEPSLGPDGRLKTARKGVGRFTITIRGRAAHAGLNPEEGASAILELSHVIQKLFALNDPERGVTVNVGMIDGGLRANVIAPTSEATVDVRVLHQEDAERIERFIRGLQPETEGITIEVSGGIGRPPMEPSEGNRRLWRLALEAGEVLGLELGEGTAGGGSDGNTTSRYAPTLDGLGPVGDGAHAEHEHVRLESLAERAALLAALLLAPPLTQREAACA